MDRELAHTPPSAALFHSDGPGRRIVVLGSDGPYNGAAIFTNLEAAQHSSPYPGYPNPNSNLACSSLRTSLQHHPSTPNFSPNPNSNPRPPQPPTPNPFLPTPHPEHTILSDRTNKPGPILCVQSGAGYHAAINIDGSVFTWGTPACGRLGRGAADELDSWAATTIPTIVNVSGQPSLDYRTPQEGVKIRDIACGGGHMLAVTDFGELYSWGDNRCAQLGVTGAGVAGEGGGSPERGAGAGAGPGLRSISTDRGFSLSSSGSSSSSNSSSSSGGAQSPGFGSSLGTIGPGGVASRTLSPGGSAGGASPTSSMGAMSPMSSSGNLSSNTGLSGSAIGGLGGTIGGMSASAYRTTDLSTVMASVPHLVDVHRVVAVACGAYHSICLSHDTTNQGGGSCVYSWGRVAGGRLGQFRDKLDIPDNAVGRPAVVRCSWRVRRYSYPNGTDALSGGGGGDGGGGYERVRGGDGVLSFAPINPGGGFGSSNLNPNPNQCRSPSPTLKEDREGREGPPLAPLVVPSSPLGAGAGAGVTSGHGRSSPLSPLTPASDRLPPPTPIPNTNPTPASPSYTIPPQPRTSARIVSIAAGFSHSLAVTQCGWVTQ